MTNPQTEDTRRALGGSAPLAGATAAGPFLGAWVADATGSTAEGGIDTGPFVAYIQSKYRDLYDL